MSETSQAEFDLLVYRAKRAGMFVQRHKSYDTARGNGDLYMQPRKFGAAHVETLLSYATAAQIDAALSEIEKAN